MQIGFNSSVGNIRENNQDNMYASKDSRFPLFLVADGMGGHKAGEIASAMAIEATIDFLSDKKELLDSEDDIIRYIIEAIIFANDKIYNISQDISEYNGMGTTLTLAYIYNSKVIIGHVGDSRAYLIHNDNIKQITEDHTLVNELIKQGTISESESLNHPQRHMITRAVGTSPDIVVDTNIVEFMAGDKLILCSDGLTNMVDDEMILSIVSKNEELDANSLSKILVTMANDNGGKDNITIILVKKDGGLL